VAVFVLDVIDLTFLKLVDISTGAWILHTEYPEDFEKASKAY
jgi:hypothetical protein